MSDQFEAPARGVYWARHTKKGCRLAYAIDSNGEEVRRYRVTAPSREAAAIETLWDLLDVVDPPRHLELVRDSAPRAPQLAPRCGWAETYDPYDPPPLVFRQRY